MLQDFAVHTISFVSGRSVLPPKRSTHRGSDGASQSQLGVEVKEADPGHADASCLLLMKLAWLSLFNMATIDLAGIPHVETGNISNRQARTRWNIS